MIRVGFCAVSQELQLQLFTSPRLKPRMCYRFCFVFRRMNEATSFVFCVFEYQPYEMKQRTWEFIYRTWICVLMIQSEILGCLISLSEVEKDDKQRSAVEA